MNNTALEKITEQITIALIVSLLPFIWYFIYLLRGGYATTPKYSVLIVSGILFLDLAMLLFSYSKIYKNFSTGFLSTYSNPTDFNLIETLNQYEKALNKVSETLNDLDKKVAEVDKFSGVDGLDIDGLDDEIVTIIKDIDTPDSSNNFKVVTVLLELTEVINLVYFYMFLMFALGLSANLDIFLKSFGITGALVTALAMIIVALIFIKAQRNITSKTLYNIFEYEASNINIERLEESLNILIENHDALRMIVLKEGKNLILERVSPYKISMYTYIGTESRKAVRSVWENYTYTPQTWPMFHFEVGKAEKGNDVLHISFDCLILDAWSAKKLISELFKLYSGERLKFPEFTFKDYLEQAVNYDYKQEKQAESYWKEKISHMKIPSFKTRIPIEAVVEPKFERVEYTFAIEETQKLYERIKKYGLTPAAAICMLFMKTICDTFALEEITLDITLFNRLPLDKEINDVIGEFTNIGLATYYKTEDISILEAAKNVQAQFWKLVQYREYDGTKLLKALGKGGVGKAIFPIVYTCMLGGKDDIEQVVFHEVYALSKTPQVMLDHHVRDDLGSLKLSFDYVIELFAREDMEKIMDTYVRNILNAITVLDWERDKIL